MRIWIILFFLCSHHSFAQSSCDPSLNPIESSIFKYQSRENRCEGLYRVKVAASRSLDIVGVLQGYLHYEMNSNEVVDLKCPTVKTRTVYVRASPIPLKTYYRMDAAIQPGKNLLWPIREVLLPNEIQSDMISVFGWYTENGEKVYTPIRASTRKNDSYNDLRYRVILRASFDVFRVVYSWKSSLDNKSSTKSIARAFKAGMPIIIPLQDKLKGKVSLVVQAEVNSSRDVWIDNSSIINLGR